MQQGSINKGDRNQKVRVLHRRIPTHNEHVYNVYSQQCLHNI